MARAKRGQDDAVGVMAAAAAHAAALAREAPTDGLGWGLRIHRYRQPRDWPEALQAVPDEHRATAEEYLRGIAARMRALRAMTGA